MTRFIFIAAFFLAPQNVQAYELTQDIRTLAKCESVYLYAAHLAQMQNNEGLARNILFRAARTSVSVFMLGEVAGNVSGDALAELRAIHSATKSELDNQTTDIMTELTACDTIAQPITSAVERMRKTLWGMDFQDLHLQVLNKFMQTLGLQK